MLCAGVGCAVVASTGMAVAASDAPSGSRPAIAAYKRSEVANASYQEISFVGHGARYGLGKGPNDISYALAFSPRGTKPASDHVSVIQRAGKVVEEIDKMSAAGQPSLVIWIKGRTWFGQLQRPGACVKKLTSEYGAANFTTIGEPFVESSGSTFAALKRVGGDEIARSTYKDEGANAREADTINSSSGLWQSSTVTYSGGPYSRPATTSMTSFRYTRDAAVIQPRVGHCLPT